MQSASSVGKHARYDWFVFRFTSECLEKYTHYITQTEIAIYRSVKAKQTVKSQ